MVYLKLSKLVGISRCAAYLGGSNTPKSGLFRRYLAAIPTMTMKLIPTVDDSQNTFQMAADNDGFGHCGQRASLEGPVICPALNRFPAVQGVDTQGDNA